MLKIWTWAIWRAQSSSDWIKHPFLSGPRGPERPDTSVSLKPALQLFIKVFPAGRQRHVSLRKSQRGQGDQWHALISPSEWVSSVSFRTDHRHKLHIRPRSCDCQSRIHKQCWCILVSDPTPWACWVHQHHDDIKALTSCYSGKLSRLHMNDTVDEQHLTNIKLCYWML